VNQIRNVLDKYPALGAVAAIVLLAAAGWRMMHIISPGAAPAPRPVRGIRSHGDFFENLDAASRPQTDDSKTGMRFPITFSFGRVGRGINSQGNGCQNISIVQYGL